MILVISDEEDISTDYFMEWCHYMGMKAVRLNRWEAMNATDLIMIGNSDEQVLFHTADVSFSLDDIEAVWFRRGYISHYAALQFDKESRFAFMNHYFKNENRTLNDFIIYKLKQKHSLNSQHHYNTNKLIALDKAAEAGLLIPNTIVGRSKEKVFAAAGNTPEKLITKSIQDALIIRHDGYRFSPGVHELNIRKEFIPDRFYYSKFQQRIHKKYELRIFFLDQDYYAAAIFTKNRVNGKGINHDININRVVPYILPDDIKGKLSALNKSLRLECGSIDMIVDEAGQYYFLEVNPVGQYDYLSKLCNYYLDYKIACYLNHPL